MGMTSRSELFEFALDLGEHESRRLTAVLEAMGDWDPGRVLADETEAHRRLFSGLDEDQFRVYRMLVEAGVLDEAA
jgi:hypothetical protein